MSQARRAAVCLAARGQSLPGFQRALSSVLAHTPPQQTELRLGFCQARYALHFTLGLLSADADSPRRQLLPGGIERFRWTSRQGFPVWAWHAQTAFGDDQLARLITHDVPLETDYAVRLGDGAYLESGWWEAALPLMDQGVDYLGHASWRDYSPGDVEKIQSLPWYMGVPFGRREGSLGVAFMTDPCIVVKSERLREAWQAAGPSSSVADVLLGEMANQLGWRQAEHDKHVGTDSL